MPKVYGDGVEPQQIGYVNVVPARNEFGVFDGFGDTVRKFNQHLRVHPLPGRDVHGNGIPSGTGNPMGIPTGMGIKHRIGNGNGNGNGREWETTSVGMGITCTPMGIYSQRFYAAMSLLIVISTILARCQYLLVPSLPTTEM